MKQPEQIEHKGTVAFVGHDVVLVNIEVMEACGSCASRKACAMGQGSTREILVSVDDAENYAVGDIVRVSAKQTVGVVAVLLCYVLPLIVMVAVLAIMVSLGFMEGTSALVALASLATYYAVLALFRKRISRKVVFAIKPMASLVESIISRKSKVESL